jgi:alpha-D-ribose 1-methylphosphonate 5-triphosphate synthase subunit PhnG
MQTASSSRAAWMTLLAQSSAAELDEHWSAIEPPVFTWIRRPEHGAAMVRGRASGTGALFNMGEVTVTRCSVQLDTGEIGVSYVTGRGKRHAALAALFDALMQREIVSGGTAIAAHVDALAEAAEARRLAIIAQAYDSKVDFFMLSSEESKR